MFLFVLTFSSKYGTKSTCEESFLYIFHFARETLTQLLYFGIFYEKFDDANKSKRITKEESH